MKRKTDKFDRMAHHWFLEWEDGTTPLTEWERNLAAALRRVDRAAERRGYQLRDAWSEMLQREHKLPQLTADKAAGHICVWCGVDSRTGKKVKKTRR